MIYNFTRHAQLENLLIIDFIKDGSSREDETFSAFDDSENNNFLKTSNKTLFLKLNQI